VAGSGERLFQGSRLAQPAGGFFECGFLVGFELDEHLAPALLNDFPHEVFIRVERIAAEAEGNFDRKMGDRKIG